MAELFGMFLSVVWFAAGLYGRQIYVRKGHYLSIHNYLWGATLGPLQLFLANLARSTN